MKAICSTSTCANPAFAKGLCNRCYHEQWRRAQGTGPRKVLAGIACVVTECVGVGYHDHPDVGVLCRIHDDRMHRTGSTELLGHNARGQCSVELCEKPMHSQSYCQAHYRKFKKYGDPLGKGQLGRPISSTQPSHQRLSIEEKEARRLARLAENATRATCVNGHSMVDPLNVYIDPKGKRICRICQAGWLGRTEKVTTSLKNGDKTHCKFGHDFAIHGYVKAGGARGCRLCEREWRLRQTYGLPRGQYAVLYEQQSGGCAGCRVVLDPADENLCVDHDHSCCAGKRSCGKCIRGLLCTNCNMVLGLVNDDVETLRRLAKYVKRGRLAV